MPVDEWCNERGLKKDSYYWHAALVIKNHASIENKKQYLQSAENTKNDGTKAANIRTKQYKNNLIPETYSLYDQNEESQRVYEEIDESQRKAQRCTRNLVGYKKLNSRTFR